MEEKTVGCRGVEGCSRDQASERSGGAVRFLAAGSQVYPQLLLWICDEERVSVMRIRESEGEGGGRQRGVRESKVSSEVKRPKNLLVLSSALQSAH